MKRTAIISTPGAKSAISTPATVSDNAMNRDAIIPEVTVKGGDSEITIKGGAVQSTAITVDYGNYQELNVSPTEQLREYEDAYTERTISLYGERVEGIFGCNIKPSPKVTLNEAAKVIVKSIWRWLSKRKVICQDVLEESSEELERLTFKTPREIMLEYMCKAIFIAINYTMFNRYFSIFSQHYTWFNTQENITITGVVLKIVFVLATKVAYQESDLPASLKTMMVINYNGKKRYNDRMADALNIIIPAISMWKCFTDTGLGLIIDLVIKYRVNFPHWKYKSESESEPPLSDDLHSNDTLSETAEFYYFDSSSNRGDSDHAYRISASSSTMEDLDSTFSQYNSFSVMAESDLKEIFVDANFNIDPGLFCNDAEQIDDADPVSMGDFDSMGVTDSITDPDNPQEQNSLDRANLVDDTDPPSTHTNIEVPDNSEYNSSPSPLSRYKT